MKIDYRELKLDELDGIRGIDRSEEVDSVYLFRSGTLVQKEVSRRMEGFPGDELEAILRRQKQLLANGGWVYGAFDSGKLVGVASLENRFRGRTHRYCKMDILFVSRDYRREGIAEKLLSVCKTTARGIGAERLYISATESKNTVDFYMKRGARLVEELDDDLFRMEPEDIHLEIVL
jgi:N-acetylglutamate synthase-like GNAT family acetyltransferase